MDSARVQALMDSLRPSAECLLELIRQHVDDSMLEEIASADTGHLSEEDLKALRQIRDEGTVFAPLRWAPGEVLRLIRWSDPEDPAWKPGSTGVRGHWMRAFACAALLRAAAEPENQEELQGENQTVAQLLESSIRLGGEVPEAALRFLAWRFGTLPRVEPIDEEDHPFFALALLLLSTHLFRTGQGPLPIPEVIALVEEEEARIRRRKEEKDLQWNPEEWLLGLTNFNQRHGTWRALARKVLLASGPALPGDMEDRVRIVGGRLVPARDAGHQP